MRGVRVKKWLLLGVAIVAEVSASLALKAALEHPVWYLLVVTGYLAAFVFLTLVLRLGLAIGVAYGIWGAMGVALTAVMSAVVFGEPLTPVMILGMALVVGGVLCVELGSRAVERRRASAS
jgi:small multidrug resistance pump